MRDEAGLIRTGEVGFMGIGEVGGERGSYPLLKIAKGGLGGLGKSCGSGSRGRWKIQRKWRRGV
jgi:hypothetical protein